MDSFPLLALPPILIQQVLGKLEHESYIRVQQTSRDMYRFIRTNRRITVHREGFTTLECDGRALHFDPQRNVEYFYGTCLEYLEVTETSNGFELLCDSLAKNRIRCSLLYMTGQSFWTRAQCLKLFNILKPREIFLNSSGSNRYEALLDVSNLKFALVHLSREAVPTAMPKLLASCPHIRISMMNIRDPYSVVCEILRIIRSNSFPKLQEFDVFICGDWETLNKNEMQAKLPGYDWNLKDDDGNTEFTAVVLLPHCSAATCTINFVFSNSACLGNSHAKIAYRVAVDSN